jgi:hypothetical protein
LGLLAGWLATVLLIGALSLRGSRGVASAFLLLLFVTMGFFWTLSARMLWPGPAAGVAYLRALPITLIVAGLTALATAPQVYLARAGTETEALITAAEPLTDEEGDRTVTSYHVIDYATERDLGWLSRGPHERAHEGDHIQVTYDRYGWADPAATERLGAAGFPTTVLVLCCARAALSALLFAVRRSP